MLTDTPISVVTSPSEETIYRAIAKTGISLGINVQRSAIFANEGDDDSDSLHVLVIAARRANIHLREIDFDRTRDALSFLHEGYPILVAKSDQSLTVIDAGSSKRLESTQFHSRGFTPNTMTHRELRHTIVRQTGHRVFVAKQELECDSLSAPHDAGHDHHHMSPVRRFASLLAMERRDISVVVLFAFVAGILTLATPLAVESLVNVVSWGVYLQPLVVLGVVLLIALGLAGILKILQKVSVEMIQRRQFVRIVGDLAHRFPRANQAAISKEYPRELANRIFDIMTIQKATSVLLLDGVSIVLTTILGMVLLAFYHPFLLGFDIVLLISMISITWILGRGGIRTAIDESITKYQTIHWLQDVLASPGAFKIGGGEALAIDRANELTSAYIEARRKQFRVVLRQASFAILLQVFASTAVLALGGWLVIGGELTLGQLVASELVVTVVVGAFAKAGKSLEKFYDLMAGVDKVGHLLDIPVDPRPEVIQFDNRPATVSWTDLEFWRAESSSYVTRVTIESGDKVAIVGNDSDGKSDLAKALVGLMAPSHGVVRVADLDPVKFASDQTNPIIGFAGNSEVFTGTIRENVDLGRPGIGQARVRAALDAVGLSESILGLSAGLQTRLQTGGYPLTQQKAARLMIARAIVSNPRLLVIDGVLDSLSPAELDLILEKLLDPDSSWTLIATTNNPLIAERFDQTISFRQAGPSMKNGTLS